MRLLSSSKTIFSLIFFSLFIIEGHFQGLGFHCCFKSLRFASVPVSQSSQSLAWCSKAFLSFLLCVGWVSCMLSFYSVRFQLQEYGNMDLKSCRRSNYSYVAVQRKTIG